MKKTKDFYSLPTPAKWRKLGDALLTAGVSISIIGTAEDIAWLAIGGNLFGIFGKFLTNLFTDEKTT